MLQQSLPQVVNCLQFFIFTRFFAVLLMRLSRNIMLWIAYNFLSLQGSLQCFFYSLFNNLGCELLTIFYLYKVLCSNCVLSTNKIIVVNCLQFFIFTRFFAVRTLQKVCKTLLWIAYNFLSLQGSLQCICVSICYCFGCELLTIFYLYKVLCSSFVAVIISCMLWIAYNFLSLQGSLQFVTYVCEVKDVVNCLQFFIFTRFFAV